MSSGRSPESRGRHAPLLAVLLAAGCGRLGFSEQVAPATPPGDEDAGQPPAPPPAEMDGGTKTPDASAPPHDAGTRRDAGTPPPEDAGVHTTTDDAGPPPPSCTSCTPNSDACPPEFPTRLWPVASDVASCVDSVGNTRSSTGLDAADYTVFNGCSTWLDFATTGFSALSLRTFGDGCQCQDCSLYHVHYVLGEDFGNGLTATLEVQEPDDLACPGGREIDVRTDYTPSTPRVRMQVLNGTTGAGFYFVVCGRP